MAQRLQLVRAAGQECKMIAFTGEATCENLANSVGCTDDDPASAWVEWCSGSRSGII
jgi:hypothetical protein